MNKYIIQVNTKDNTAYNPIHEIVDKRPGVILEAEIGKRGWIAYKLEEDTIRPWHRLHTSNIEDITETDEQIVVTTENTIYKLIRV